MQKISVTIPTGTGPRPAVARQTMQNAINRSIPALSYDDKSEQALYKTSPAFPQHKNRVCSSGTSASFATNEFSTRTRGSQSRQPAKTSVVNFGNIFVHPSEKVNARGVNGFFPPLKIKGDGGSMRTRYSMSAPAGSGSLSPRNSNQESTSSNHSATQHQPKSSKDDRNREDWPKSSSSIRNNQSPVRFQQGHGQTSDPSVPGRESVEDMRMTGDSGHVTALSSASRSSLSNKNRDAPFVRAYKLKQKRQHKIKEIMDSKYKSPTMEDLHVKDVEVAW